MDILVTIPKNEYSNDDLENANIESGHSAFWTLSKIPKQLNSGDRIYFVKNNKIDSSMQVTDILTDSQMECETTGRTWSGKCQLLLDDYKTEKNDDYIKGFQGYRYIENKISRLRKVAEKNKEVIQ